MRRQGTAHAEFAESLSEGYQGAIILQNARMTREPFGTKQAGQAFLAALGLCAGVGGAAGLLTWPTIFEPILIAALALLRTHLHYVPAQRGFFALLLALFGIGWAAAMVVAFAREPARNRNIDASRHSRNRLDHARKATANSQDDPLLLTARSDTEPPKAAVRRSTRKPLQTAFPFARQLQKKRPAGRNC